MSKYHINNKEMPAACRSKNCKKEIHFDTEEEAQFYLDSKNERSHGLVPELKFKYVKGEYKDDEYEVDEEIKRKLTRVLNEINLEEIIDSVFEELYYFIFVYRKTIIEGKYLEMFSRVRWEDGEYFVLEGLLEEMSHDNDTESNWEEMKVEMSFKEMLDEMISRKVFHKTSSPIMTPGAIFNYIFEILIERVDEDSYFKLGQRESADRVLEGNVG